MRPPSPKCGMRIQQRILARYDLGELLDSQLLGSGYARPLSLKTRRGRYVLKKSVIRNCRETLREKGAQNFECKSFNIADVAEAAEEQNESLMSRRLSMQRAAPMFG